MNLFWIAIWEYTGIIGERDDLLFDASFPMDKPNPNLIRAKMNFAENILLAHSHGRSHRDAVVSVIEPDCGPSEPDYLNSTFLRSLTWEGLYQEVNAIEPKVLLTADFYRYAGKRMPVFDKLLAILESLPSITNVVVVGHLQRDRHPVIPFPQTRKGRAWQSWGEVVQAGRETAKGDITFWRGPAMAPIYVLYSSGTTGKPKAIVHSVGGMVLSSKMANLAHTGFSDKDTFMQFSTLGWMMWNYALSALSGGTKVVMYDGSPLSPQLILFDLVDEHQITFIGISPRYLQVLDTAKYFPNQHHSLESLRAIVTAGSVLKGELYDWIYDNIGTDVFISKGTGGTDCPALGMLVQSWDDAELYAVVEEMREDVEDCIAIGQRLPDADERVILFVKPKDKLTPAIVERIRSAIRAALSQRHVPAKIIAVDRIPCMLLFP
ncbi:hypothetical protein RQP46_010809 [Phenoliferia psychrophenolica]